MTMDGTRLPVRAGLRPATTPSNPHTQLEQIAPVDLQDRLRDHALSLPQVRRGASRFSVPGAVAFYLDAPPEPSAVPDLFGGEWGHIHPHYDGSLHLNVPTELAERLIAAGWAEYHSLVARGHLPPLVVMLYGPRDEADLAVCAAAVEEAYLANGGARHDAAGRPLGFADA
ncbi:luciferase family protein [Nocardioides pantholopis]|uniref:luciferase domain-containing protein n=1 Tax=Nocardioides pantholopis TaxID=2483798 RepID=UPI0019D1C3B3|nr:luciferase family protein [Nocardioides pantholopis]